MRLAEALNHLYVLLPVLDDAKHYWVSPDEVDKLVRAGGGWLAGHPEKTLITNRYLRHRGSLTRVALARLADVDDLDPEQLDDADAAAAGRSRSRTARCRWPSCAGGAVLAAVRAGGSAHGRRPRLRRGGADRRPAGRPVDRAGGRGRRVGPDRWRSPRRRLRLDRMTERPAGPAAALPVLADLPRRAAARAWTRRC